MALPEPGTETVDVVDLAPDGTGQQRDEVVATMTLVISRMLRPDQPVTEHTTLMGDLGLSSARAMELLLEVEDNLSIAIDVDELDEDNMYTLGELADYIASHSTAT